MFIGVVADEVDVSVHSPGQQAGMYQLRGPCLATVAKLSVGPGLGGLQLPANCQEEFTCGRTEPGRDDVRPKVFLEALFHADLAGSQEAINVAYEKAAEGGIAIGHERGHHFFEGVSVDVEVLMEIATHEGGQLGEELLALGMNDWHRQGMG